MKKEHSPEANNADQFDMTGYTEYEMIAKVKGEDGVDHVEKHQLRANRYARSLGQIALADLIVRDAKPTKVSSTKRVKPKRWGSYSMLLPDAQIPFHDPVALELAHIAVRETQPDNLVIGGDWLDFPNFSRFEIRPEWVHTVQEQLDIYHEHLARFRADIGKGVIWVLFGNHEERLQKSIIKNNAELLGIKRANAQEMGVLALESLLRFDELDIQSVPGYPNGVLWLEDHLKAMHGTIARQRSSAAIEYLKQDPSTSTVYNHDHRTQLVYWTTPTREGSMQRFAVSGGTLSKIDGSVPSYHSTFLEDGSVVKRAENWQQAVVGIHHDSKRARPEIYQILDGEIMIEGQLYSVHE